MSDYRNAAQERGYDVLLALAGREFTGLAPGEIAHGLQVSASSVTRDLRVLQAKGLAEQITATGRWRLGPKLVQIGLAYAHAAEREARNLHDITQRYSRTPT